MGNRNSLVNGSKAGVIVKMRQRNLTSMRDRCLQQNRFNKNHTCTLKSHPLTRVESNYDEHF